MKLTFLMSVQPVVSVGKGNYWTENQIGVVY